MSRFADGPPGSCDRICRVRDLVDLVVILAVFLTAATVAAAAGIPAIKWAAGGNDWQVSGAIVWFCACFAAAMRAAWVVIAAYRARQ